MTKAKYVIINKMGIEMPIIFNPLIEHKNFEHLNIVAAGFCNRVENVWECWGGSVSLEVNSRFQIDTDVLNQFLFYDM